MCFHVSTKKALRTWTKNRGKPDHFQEAFKFGPTGNRSLNSPTSMFHGQYAHKKLRKLGENFIANLNLINYAKGPKEVSVCPKIIPNHLIQNFHTHVLIPPSTENPQMNTQFGTLANKKCCHKPIIYIEPPSANEQKHSTRQKSVKRNAVMEMSQKGARYVGICVWTQAFNSGAFQRFQWAFELFLLREIVFKNRVATLHIGLLHPFCFILN